MNNLQPTPETNAAIDHRLDGDWGDFVSADFARKLERERDEARAEAGRLLVVESHQKDQLEAMREAVEKLRDSLEVGKDSVETWDWCNKMLANLQPPTKP